jgi:NAD(P)-dependent dehydrogenase (short-subunit alcohol dehydrogenase family)
MAALFDPASRVATGMLLAGRTVVISGAARARGIGRATARLFGQHGACVALLDLDEAEADEAARDVTANREQAFGVRCDVTDADSCRAAVERVLACSWS